jgi:hypothetical protein
MPTLKLVLHISSDEFSFFINQRAYAMLKWSTPDVSEERFAVSMQTIFQTGASVQVSPRWACAKKEGEAVPVVYRVTV